MNSITSLKKEISRLKRFVHHDQLTGLYNRLGFAENINDYLNELKGEHKKGNKNKRSFKIGNLSVVFADLNDLKEFNDKYGHACGDEAIKAFAKLLKKGVRGIDVVCRWSGDEFVVALVGADKKDEPMQLKAGDTVFYGKYSGTELNIDGIDYLLMSQTDVLYII